ncbi:hypothetical protein ACFU5O_18265 [Streptomyces sp. NPDC057445]|uniref:hypothetical protein n=1 Tax=Streptomyces sp. NPDC057445 TaxID=3346136 RepID=UPI0036944429
MTRTRHILATAAIVVAATAGATAPAVAGDNHTPVAPQHTGLSAGGEGTTWAGGIAQVRDRN